ncbi:hypothetical protein GOODEAATRI_000546 [Goodea atripinnis]|uniref:Uncharacterized protein n=1 Tax=Goodea atripinnis TaxID=208336 RepID=A0ABV0N6R1_9TELE
MHKEKRNDLHSFHMTSRIRSALLDSEEHICYTCKQSDVSPDNLIANKFLRQAVNNFKNETGYTKHGRKQVQHAAPLPPRPQLVRPLQSRQQDPLLVNAANPPSASTEIEESILPLMCRVLPPLHLPFESTHPPCTHRHHSPTFLNTVQGRVSSLLLPLVSILSLSMPLDHQGLTPPGSLQVPSPLSCHYLHPCHNPLSQKKTSTDKGTIDKTSMSYGYRRSGSPRSPLSYRGGGWDGAEAPRPYRSRTRSRSPGGYRGRSPGGRKPPPRELLAYDLKGHSPANHDRWERERYRQWEKEYADWYNKYYKDFNNQHPPLHHRGHGSRDGEREKISASSRDYSPQGRGRRGKEERGGPPHNPPSSSSSGAKSSTKILKSKKIKKKKPGEEQEQSRQSLDRGDATPVRDEPMDEISSNTKTPPISSRPLPSGGAATPKATSSKGTAAPAKPATKSTSNTQADKMKKEKLPKVKAKVKTQVIKTKSEKVKKMPGEGVTTTKDSSTTSSAVKPIKTIKTKADDASNSSVPKKEKPKSSTVRPVIKTPPTSSQNQPLPHHSLLEGPRSSHDSQSRRDPSKSAGLLPLHRPSLLPRPPSPIDSRRRMGEDSRTLLGPPEKLRRIDGGGAIFHSHLHPSPFHRLPPPSDRPGLLHLPGTRELGRIDSDRGPLVDVPVTKVSAHLLAQLGRCRSFSHLHVPSGREMMTKKARKKILPHPPRNPHHCRRKAEEERDTVMHLNLSEVKHLNASEARPHMLTLSRYDSGPKMQQATP